MGPIVKMAPTYICLSFVILALCIQGSIAAPQNGINTESRIARQASREALVVEDPKEAGVVNYINVAPNNGLGNSLIKGEDFEGSGESVYQPFVSSNNILRASTTTTTTTPRTTRRTTIAPRPQTPDPNVQIYARGTIVRNNFGTHIVLGK